MSGASFDFEPLLRAGLPAAAARWTGRVKHDFTGGNNDADALPLDELIAAADSVLRREGRTLSTYGLKSARRYQPALAAGVAINPGPERSVNKAHGRSRLRLCFASPTHEEIHGGIATLADICRREFGVPAPGGNADRAR